MIQECLNISIFITSLLHNTVHIRCHLRLMLNTYTFWQSCLTGDTNVCTCYINAYVHARINYKNTNYLINHFAGVAQLLIFANGQCSITLLSWWKFCLHTSRSFSYYISCSSYRLRTTRTSRKQQQQNNTTH